MKVGCSVRNFLSDLVDNLTDKQTRVKTVRPSAEETVHTEAILCERLSRRFTIRISTNSNRQSLQL